MVCGAFSHFQEVVEKLTDDADENDFNHSYFSLQ